MTGVHNHAQFLLSMLPSLLTEPPSLAAAPSLAMLAFDSTVLTRAYRPGPELSLLRPGFLHMVKPMQGPLGERSSYRVIETDAHSNFKNSYPVLLRSIL